MKLIYCQRNVSKKKQIEKNISFDTLENFNSSKIINNPSFENNLQGWFFDKDAKDLYVNTKEAENSFTNYLIPEGDSIIEIYNKNRCEKQYVYQVLNNLNPESSYVVSYETRLLHTDLKDVKKAENYFSEIDVRNINDKSLIKIRNKKYDENINDWYFKYVIFKPDSEKAILKIEIPKLTFYAYDNFHIEEIKNENKRKNLQYNKNKIDVLNVKINENELDKISSAVHSSKNYSDVTSKYIPELKAVLISRNKKFNISLSPGPGGLENWLFEKRLLKIKLKDGFYEGVKRFRLQPLPPRQGMWDYISNFLAIQLGLNPPKHKFVWLKINGVDKGVYYFIESLKQEYLDSKSLFAGNIFGERNENEFLERKSDVNDYKSYLSKKNLSDKNKKITQLSILLSLIHNKDKNKDKLINNKNIWDILDKKNFYNWIVHQRLLNSIHQDKHHNNRFFFNNISGKFEFIPWDLLNIYNIENLPFLYEPHLGNYGDLDRKYNPFIDYIISNPEYLQERNIIMWKYVNDHDAVKKLNKFINKTYFELLPIIIKDKDKRFNLIEFLNQMNQKNYLLKNIIWIEKILDNNLGATKKIIFYEQNTNLIAKIKIENASLSAIELDRISIKLSSKTKKEANIFLIHDSNKNNELDDNDKVVGKFFAKDDAYHFKRINFRVSPKIIFPVSTYNDQKFEYVKIKKNSENFFIYNESSEIIKFDPNSSKIRLKNFVNKRTINTELKVVDTFVYTDFNKLRPSIIDFDNNYPYLKKINTYIIKAGKHKIYKDLVVPEDFLLIIEPGAELQFDKDTSLIVYGNIIANGKKNLPITFKKINEIDKPWGVVALVGKKSFGEFSYCSFREGNMKYFNGINFTGMLSVYNSKTFINNCEFLSSKGDDGVNIKSSQAIISESNFIGNNGDAIDLDFTDENTAIISNYISNNLGDGIDLSGSNSLLYNNRIEKSEDKGISIGERSDAQIINNLISENIVGIAIKDNSKINSINNSLINNNIGIASYTKKENYNGQTKVNVISNILENKNLDISNSNQGNSSFSISNTSYENNDESFIYNIKGSNLTTYTKKQFAEELLNNTIKEKDFIKLKKIDEKIDTNEIISTVDIFNYIRTNYSKFDIDQEIFDGNFVGKIN